MSYEEFIKSKVRKEKPMGFDVAADKLNANLFDWQRRIVQWALKRGRVALFEDTGHGKTLQELAWGEHVVKETNKPVILHCPIGVRQQTKREADKFAIDCEVKVVNEQSEVIKGINLVNYEKMHHFDATAFSGVILGEASILKSFTGKIKRQLCTGYASTPYRLTETATPAPNDHMELGNQSDFLGVMPSNEMLSRWFINDTMKAGGYRLRGHAKKDFWAWVASWAVCISKPSDIGGDDTGYILPPLNIEYHLVEFENEYVPDGYFFNMGSANATSIHKEKRQSNEARAAKTAEIVATDKTTPWVVWCDTDYESAMLGKLVADSVELRGSDKETEKERKLTAFASGEIRVLITKPDIAGHGLNWQHCNNTVFAGRSFSFEKFYQAVRRFYRFGQTKQVNVHVTYSESESTINRTIDRKAMDHAVMQSSMADAMRDSMLENLGLERMRSKYVPKTTIQLPSFIQGNLSHASN